jgi:hypothetical protein
MIQNKGDQSNHEKKARKSRWKTRLAALRFAMDKIVSDPRWLSIWKKTSRMHRKLS